MPVIAWLIILVCNLNPHLVITQFQRWWISAWVGLQISVKRGPDSRLVIEGNTKAIYGIKVGYYFTMTHKWSKKRKVWHESTRLVNVIIVQNIEVELNNSRSFFIGSHTNIFWNGEFFRIASKNIDFYSLFHSRATLLTMTRGLQCKHFTLQASPKYHLPWLNSRFSPTTGTWSTPASTGSGSTESLNKNLVSKNVWRHYAYI